MNINKVTLVGRLTRDPEIRTTNTGSTVASISLATNSYWTDKNGQKQETTEFHNIVLFGKVAEIAGQYLVKGQEAFFEGRLQTRSYTGKDNVERRVTEVVATEMQFGAKPQGQSGYGAPRTASNPMNQSQSPRSNVSPATAAPAQNTPVSAMEEEIPTINLDEEQEEIKIEDVPF
ncbi:MAG: single-stranded DNA-binding protein [Parcubacteria group bacterium]|jgi:single-strand DNA-binding protein